MLTAFTPLWGFQRHLQRQQHNRENDENLRARRNPPYRTIDAGDADNCVNTFSLVATVGGQVVANSTDNNSNWGKSGNIVFDVPAGSAFSVTSAGMVNYGCDYGTFSMLQYQ
ncbi:hypothetical protein [Escherichia coli]|uniref:hypothetical protein n=1 Tax=Escherichia coli TaxID=562 RepID=UPI001184FA8C|nr:hypothetical protein [Escherichia coli]